MKESTNQPRGPLNPINPGYPGSEVTTHTPWRPPLSWNLSEKLSLSIVLLSAVAQFRRPQKDCISTTARRTQGVCMIPIVRRSPSVPDAVSLGSSISPLRRPRIWTSSSQDAAPPPLAAETKTCTMNLTARRSKWMLRTSPSSSTSQVPA